MCVSSNKQKNLTISNVGVLIYYHSIQQISDCNNKDHYLTFTSQFYSHHLTQIFSMFEILLIFNNIYYNLQFNAIVVAVDDEIHKLKLQKCVKPMSVFDDLITILNFNSV